jgi:hypothetical protein
MKKRTNFCMGCHPTEGFEEFAREISVVAMKASNGAV